MRNICILGTTHTHTLKHTDKMKIHISELESHMLIPPTQWHKLYRMQNALLSRFLENESVKYSEEKRSQHHWAEIKKRLIIPDECFIVDRLRQRSAVDRGQKTRFRNSWLKYFQGMYLKERRGNGLARERRKSGTATHRIMSQFSSALIPARLFLNRLIPTRCTVSDPTFPTRLSIKLSD